VTNERRMHAGQGIFACHASCAGTYSLRLASLENRDALPSADKSNAGHDVHADPRAGGPGELAVTALGFRGFAGPPSSWEGLFRWGPFVEGRVGCRGQRAAAGAPGGCLVSIAHLMEAADMEFAIGMRSPWTRTFFPTCTWHGIHPGVAP
jgi:hypothetical protein